MFFEFDASQLRLAIASRMIIQECIYESISD